jgi:hypothetical protein
MGASEALEMIAQETGFAAIGCFETFALDSNATGLADGVVFIMVAFAAVGEVVEDIEFGGVEAVVA